MVPGEVGTNGLSVPSPVTVDLSPGTGAVTPLPQPRVEKTARGKLLSLGSATIKNVGPRKEETS